MKKEFEAFCGGRAVASFQVRHVCSDQNVPQLGLPRNIITNSRATKNDSGYLNRLHIIVRDHNFEADHRTQVHLYAVEYFFSEIREEEEFSDNYRGVSLSSEQFSRRHGFGADAAEISIRDSAPQNVRGAILMIAEGELHLSPHTIRDWLCTVLRELPNPNNWSAYPNVWEECQSLMYDAPWYRVYDFVELVHNGLANSQDSARAQQWAEAVNEYFVEAGVGWRLVNGRLESRGQEAFESVVDNARSALQDATLITARQEIHEALQDLSRRPQPDLTGAVQHAMAALECTARQATGDTRATLGEILRRHPNMVPRPLDESLSRLWGYASEMARHIREGRTPNRSEAELAVTVAAAVCTYLAQALSVASSQNTTNAPF